MVEERPAAGAETAAPAAGSRVSAPPVADPRSAMTPRYNVLARWFAARFFAHFDLDDASVARLRALEERGSVVYVMRYSSRLDYFLFNTLFAREGLRLSAFANGLSFYYYQPFFAGLGRWLRRRRLLGAERREADRRRAREQVRRATAAGESLFLFLRTGRFSGVLRGREAVVAEGRRELSLLVEILDVARTQEKPVHLVPLALFWRKGPPVRRFGKLTMGSASRPSDLAKVSSFLLTYRDLAIKVGEPIELSAFAAKQPDLAGEPLARRLRRSILLFLAGEERVAEGPRLRPRHRVQDSVLRDPRVAAAIAARALEEGTPEAARASAEKMFREIAANMNPSFLATLAATVNAIFRRLFAAIVPVGLERVAAIARTTPVVLVPSHRSYFDFLVMSWLFYDNRLMPPHIAARENMAFGPFGYVFRRVGAFFLRRAFDDDLYKAVFRSYVGYLVREGFTQEFFIEGARSRTGKSLAPRMGILSWNVRGFIDSGRRDLFFVPVGISYERLVEEGAMVDELEGGEKQGESMLGLVRARKVLRRRFGSVFLNFGEPISLAQALQGHRAAFEAGAEEDPAAQEERRAVVEGLGHEIVERINWAMVANATSVAACALLAEPRRGMFRHELAQHMRRIVDLLVLQDVRLTPALSADAPAYDESIDFLLRSGLVKSEVDERGEILFYEESKQRALDVYRNVLVHFLVVPSLIARRALRGASRVELREDVAYWLELLYREFYVPRALVQAAHVDAFIDDFVRTGALEDRDGVLHSSEAGRPDLVFIAGQTAALFEAYATACAALARLDGTTPLRTLEKEAREQFRRALLVGEVQRSEAWNPMTFRNAVELLSGSDIVVMEGSGKDTTLQPGPAFAQLPELRERLAGALGSG